MLTVALGFIYMAPPPKSQIEKNKQEGDQAKGSERSTKSSTPDPNYSTKIPSKLN
jgi:hypothetical protein